MSLLDFIQKTQEDGKKTVRLETNCLFEQDKTVK